MAAFAALATGCSPAPAARRFFASCGAASECESNLCVNQVCTQSCSTSSTCGDGICIEKVCVPRDRVACTSDAACAQVFARLACTVATCGPKKRCIAAVAPHGTSCNAGDCGPKGSCANGVCKSALPHDSGTCADGNACTADSCAGELGCQYTPSSGACDDGDACTLGDQCQAGACQPGAPLACDDQLACTDDSCDPATGCTHAARNGPCSDGNVCTTNDTCADGACLPGAATVCDDGSPCTSDGCDPTTGCQFAAIAGPCDDGSLCTQNDACSSGVCVAGAPLACADGKVCTADSCDAKLGCVFVELADGSTCDDGKVCTIQEGCVAGACYGKPKSCDDGNPCTNDSCDPQSGCVAAESSGPCNDGQVCTVGDFCVGATCQGQPQICDDQNPCTTDSCDPMVGCTFTTGGKAEACDGVDNDCNGATDEGCDDDKDGYCDAALGKPLTKVVCPLGGGDCSDTQATVHPGAIEVCDTVDNDCDGQTDESVVCDDGDPCTVAEACVGGACKPGGSAYWNVAGLGDYYSGMEGLASDGSRVAFAGRHHGKGYAWFQVRDLGGTVLNSPTADPPGVVPDYGEGWDTFHDVAAIAGGWVAVGEHDGNAQGTSADALLQWFTSSGQLASTSKLFTGLSKESLQTVTATSTGLVACGQSGEGSQDGGDVWLLTFAVDGSAMKSVLIDAGSYNDYCSAMVAMPNGDVTVAAMGKNGAWFGRFDLAGNQKWLVGAPAGAQGTGTYHDLTRTKSGLVAVGTAASEQTPGTTDVLVTGLDDAGKVLWSTHLGSTADDEARAVLAVGDGVLVGGYSLGYGATEQAGVVWRVDAWGAESWHKAIPKPANSLALEGFGRTLTGLIGVGGFVYFAGRDDANKWGDGWMGRTDAWGNTSCSEAGVCVSQFDSGCDDVNPCTIDLCAKGAGCSHAKVADGTGCATAKTCVSGVCK